MICIECKKQNIKSIVYDRGGWMTDMYCAPYYDENGVYHHHDYNITTHHFECSNGHKFSNNSYRKCLSCDWTNEPKETE